jgi:hypothetical protein
MRNDKAFLKMLTLGRNLKTAIVIGLCFYIATLSLTALAHDQNAHAHSEDACTACFYNSQHVGTEIESTALIFPFRYGTTLPLYEVSVFLPLKLSTNTRSRAPPVFSNELSIAVC